MGAVFLTLLHMSLAASALVVVVVVLRLLLKRAPKAIHCALWAMVALRLLLPSPSAKGSRPAATAS